MYRSPLLLVFLVNFATTATNGLSITKRRQVLVCRIETFRL